jgi:pSer/pThr/pTyr-binding forkhead associated (FHA) protein
VSRSRSVLAGHSVTPAELKDRLDADRRGEPYLLFLDDEGRQRLRFLRRGGSRHTVGRAVSADVPLSWDEQVSRVHAEIERVGDDWAVVDNGLSRNGTFVNGMRLSGRRRLCDGDVLRFGSTQVVFRAPIAALGETLADEAGAAPSLTDAQRRVLVALCRPCCGRAIAAAPASNRQIAEELVLSVEAVKTQLRALFQLFGVEDLPQNAKRARLVELALEGGAVTAKDVEP